MEKLEILRCKGLSKTTKHIDLKNINLNICKDEFISLYGLNDQTIPTLISILSENQPLDSGVIDYAQEYHPSNCKIDTKLFRNTRMIKNLTIAENIGIVGSATHPLLLFSPSKNLEHVQEIFSSFHLSYNLGSTIDTLSIVEIYILEILQIYLNGGNTIFLMDFYLFNESEQTHILNKILLSLKEKGIAFIFVNYSITHIMYISDRILIFDNGRLCKTVYKGEFSIRDLNNVFANENISDSALRIYQDSAHLGTENLVTAHSISLNLSADKQCTSGIFIDNNTTQNIEHLILQHDTFSLTLDFHALTSTEKTTLFNHKIYVVSENFDNLLFKDLTVQDNIIITKLQDLSFFKLILNMNFYHYLIKKRREYTNHLNINQILEKLSHYDRFCTFLDRIVLLKGNAIIINFPHAFCDSKELTLLKEFITRLKSETTHVIIISDNYQFLKECSNNLIICDNDITN